MNKFKKCESCDAENPIENIRCTKCFLPFLVVSRKMLVKNSVLSKITRKMLFDDPMVIEGSFRKNLSVEGALDSCFEALSWLNDICGIDHGSGFYRSGENKFIRVSTDGSMLYGIFEIDGTWYKSSFKTGRLFFKLWGTDVGCVANVPEKDINVILSDFNAVTYTHLKAEFSSAFSSDYCNNAFFSWKDSKFYGCIRHLSNKSDRQQDMVTSEFSIKISKENFFNRIKPYALKAE